MLTPFGCAPHRHEREWFTVRKIDAQHPKNIRRAQGSCDVARCFFECEFENMSRRCHSACSHLVFDRRETTERLSHRVTRSEPPEALSRIDETFVTQQLESLANGDSTHRELRRQL